MVDLEQLEELTAETFFQCVRQVESGICLLFKPTCPHCEVMAKVIRRFSTMAPEATLLALNTSEHKSIAQHYRIDRLPAVMVIKHGVVVSKRSGLLKPRHLHALYLMIEFDSL